MDFTDRNVVVTGGTGALGTAVVAALLDAGATVHVPAFEAEVSAAWPHRGHPRVSVVTSQDLSDEDTVTAFYAALPSLWASIHCAGGFVIAPVAETSLRTFRTQLDRNLVSAFLCCREAIKSIRRTGGQGGRIVNVTARPALEPRLGVGSSAYVASKAGLAAMTQAIAQEVSGEGIWVNAVAPSLIDTPANRESMPKADHSRWPSTDALAATMVWLAAPENQATRGALVPQYGRT